MAKASKKSSEEKLRVVLSVLRGDATITRWGDFAFDLRGRVNSTGGCARSPGSHRGEPPTPSRDRLNDYRAAQQPAQDT